MSPGTTVSLRPTGLSSRENLENHQHEETQMTAPALPSIGASSASSAWEAINWPTAQRTVRRLQKRIARAIRESRRGCTF